MGVLRLEASFSQGARCRTLIKRYIGTMPPSGDMWADEQRRSGVASPKMLVTSAMIAKLGAAARPSQSAPVPVVRMVIANPLRVQPE